MTSKQKEVYEKFSSGEYKEILVGGGGSGGKSYGIANIVTATCVAYPGIARLVGRDNLKKLKQSVRLTFLKVWKTLGFKKDLHYTINMQDMVVDFQNGSRIFFADLGRYPSDPFYDRLGSMELTYSRIEEGQEIDPIVSDTLSGRYRHMVKEYDLNPCTIITCNPKKGYLYDRFIENPNEHRVFIPILYTDNPYIDQKKYREGILATGNDVQIQRLLHGNREYDNTPGKLYDYKSLLNIQHNIAHRGEKYISIDGATMGEDLAVLIVRDGFFIEDIVVRDKSTTTQIANEAKNKAKQYGIPLQNIVNDHVGVGDGISTQIGEVYRYASNLSPIQEKGEPKSYGNLRDQCFFEIKKHIHKIGINEHCKSYVLQIVEELDAITQIDIDKDGPYKINKKEDIKKTLGNSPNFADAISMRMVFELDTTPEVLFLVA